ncbi:MAG: hypothetical protein AABY22_29830, partial [Nanoarchaeota archaeon]
MSTFFCATNYFRVRRIVRNHQFVAKEIFSLLGITRNQLSWMRKCGLSSIKKSINRSLYDLDECKELLEKLYSDNTNEIINDYLNTNLTLREIAKKYNTSQPTISLIINRNNLTWTRGEKFRDNYMNIINDYQNGIPPFIIRSKYGISKTHLKRLVRKFGVKIRNRVCSFLT